MSTKALLLAVILVFAHGVAAQSAPDWQIFGGYSYFHADAGSITLSNGANVELKQGSSGWHASVGENVNSWFGAVFDFSGDYANRDVNLLPLIGVDQTVRLNFSAYPFLFGPQFTYRPRGFSLFVHPLVGGVYARANVPGGTEPITATHWAYAFGGGADYPVSDRVAIRVQADWIRSHFPEALAVRDWQNNYRVSAGLVLMIGTAPH